MAGHSQFANIMHRKGAQDAKRAKVFTKLIRELTVAAKANPDPSANPRLRAAMVAARDANMPKDTIDRAIRRASGGEDGADYFEMRYEGYGPGGVAIIVEALTDNRNRTAADIRAAFSKHGGSLGETNSVSFMFDRVAEIAYAADKASPDAMFEAALEAGADNVESGEDGHLVTAAVENFAALREALEARFGPASRAGLVWRPQNAVAVDEEHAAGLLKLMEVLDDHDDVQTVAANFEIAEDVMQRLTA